uniref:UBC n=1 Tax=Arundo donax TaxID=35708 RepID=A0A0A9AMK0_ARUDO
MFVKDVYFVASGCHMPLRVIFSLGCSSSLLVQKHVCLKVNVRENVEGPSPLETGNCI